MGPHRDRGGPGAGNRLIPREARRCGCRASNGLGDPGGISPCWRTPGARDQAATPSALPPVNARGSGRRPGTCDRPLRPARRPRSTSSRTHNRDGPGAGRTVRLPRRLNRVVPRPSPTPLTRRAGSEELGGRVHRNVCRRQRRTRDGSARGFEPGEIPSPTTLKTNPSGLLDRRHTHTSQLCNGSLFTALLRFAIPPVYQLLTTVVVLCAVQAIMKVPAPTSTYVGVFWVQVRETTE